MIEDGFINEPLYNFIDKTFDNDLDMANCPYSLALSVQHAHEIKANASKLNDQVNRLREPLSKIFAFTKK